MTPDEDPHLARISLLGCMIGVISTIDLLNIKESMDKDITGLVEEYYTRTIEAHSNLAIYEELIWTVQ